MAVKKRRAFICEGRHFFFFLMFLKHFYLARTVTILCNSLDKVFCKGFFACDDTWLINQLHFF